MSEREPDLLIVGAGLSGLSCALHAQRLGLRPVVVDAADRPGGRVATDRVEGFLLDRGFQVLLDSYPELRRLGLDRELSLRPYEPGALLATREGMLRMADPWRRPLASLQSALSRCGTWADKLALAAWRSEAVGGRRAPDARPETSARERLEELGLGEELIDRFFRPFFGGVFLDLELETSSRMLDFLFPLFATGSACLPRGGMAALPAAMAARLPSGALRLSAPVESIGPGELRLASGETLRAPELVVAADATTAAQLLPGRVPDRDWRGAACAYYAAERDPVGEPILVLDGEGEGPVTNLSVPSSVNADYAPLGAHLVSAAIVGAPEAGDAELDAAVREQLRGWFGEQVRSWRLLRVDRIPRALPAQLPGSLEPWQRAPRLEAGLLACGDWLTNASIDGALASGRRAAEEAAAAIRSAA